MSDIVERLKYGIIEHRKRWSGDTHSDLGGSADYEATGQLMDEAAAEITRLREKVALADALVAAAREEALREAYKNLRVYAPTLVDGPEHDIGYYHGYSTAMNRILDMLQEDFPRKAKKPNLVGTGVQMGILKKNPGNG